MRADGKGIGRHADGVFDTLVQAPTMREIIDMGFLTDYRIFTPNTNIDLSHVPLASDGDYSKKPLSAAVHESGIVGDMVEHYLKIAPGKIGVAFCVDIESCHEGAAAFRKAGIPADVVTGDSSPEHRDSCIRKLERGDLKVLFNVDLFGEGFDLPAIEVVIMARPTMSFSLFLQQFGRALRKLLGKQWGIIIDHVGNVKVHAQLYGLPDAIRVPLTLDRRSAASRSAATALVPVRSCPFCTATYDRVIGPTCPSCGETALPAERSAPEHVDGVLHELSPEYLAALRGEIEILNGPPKVPYGAKPEIIGAIHKRQRERLSEIEKLKHAIALWAAGKTDIAKAQREFFIQFGVDVMTAQLLSRADAETLRGKILS
jgi:hypothetical protein